MTDFHSFLKWRDLLQRKIFLRVKFPRSLESTTELKWNQLCRVYIISNNYFEYMIIKIRTDFILDESNTLRSLCKFTRVNVLQETPPSYNWSLSTCTVANEHVVALSGRSYRVTLSERVDDNRQIQNLTGAIDGVTISSVLSSDRNLLTSGPMLSSQDNPFVWIRLNTFCDFCAKPDDNITWIHERNFTFIQKHEFSKKHWI